MMISDEPISKISTSVDRNKWPKCDRCKTPSKSVHKKVTSTSDEWLCGKCGWDDWEKQHRAKA